MNGGSKRSARIVQVVALAVSAGLLFGVARLTPSINEGRRELNIASIGAESPLENTPPEYAFAVQAFGAFRGILTNLAFIRANEYKEQGRYYDAMQLAMWICKLQPHFPSVWEFNSWNMAWNISVTTYTPEERWNWVYNGVKLIRDEGLRFNPRAVNLYKQVAWIYVNKMSETVDEHHQTYKRNWAWHMHLVFGDPPDPLREYSPDVVVEDFTNIGQDAVADAVRKERERREKLAAETALPLPDTRTPPVVDPGKPDATKAPGNEKSGATSYEIVKKASHDLIKSIDNAPRTLPALYAQTPETRDIVHQLAGMGVVIKDDRLGEDEYWRSTGLAFTFFQRWRKLSDRTSIYARVAKNVDPDPDAANLDAFDRIVGVTTRRPEGLALQRFIQRKTLTEVYKLEISHMATVVELFGPVDWRSVDAHSLYWGTLAIIKGGETISSFGNDKTNMTRLIFFSLRNLMNRNHIVFEPYPRAIANSYFNATPDLNFIEPMHQAYLTYGRTIDPDPGIVEAGAGDTFRAGHVNFLTEAIRLLYLADRLDEAAHYYAYLREAYSRNEDGTVNTAFAKPLDVFFNDSFYEGIDGPRETMQAVAQLLANAFEELADGKIQRYNSLARRAHDLHQTFMQEKAGKYSEHQRLPAFNDIHSDTLRFLLAQPAISLVQMLHKVRLWTYLPQNLKRAVYDEFIEGFTAECDYFKLEVAKAFPEPAGMKEYREEMKRRGPEDKPKTFETPAQPAGG